MLTTNETISTQQFMLNHIDEQHALGKTDKLTYNRISKAVKDNPGHDLLYYINLINEVK